MASLQFILDPGLKFHVSGFDFSESMNDGSMLAHLKSDGRDDHKVQVQYIGDKTGSEHG